MDVIPNLTFWLGMLERESEPVKLGSQGLYGQSTLTTASSSLR